MCLQMCKGSVIFKTALIGDELQDIIGHYPGEGRTRNSLLAALVPNSGHSRW